MAECRWRTWFQIVKKAALWTKIRNSRGERDFCPRQCWPS
jgi:hypothetical protein